MRSNPRTHSRNVVRSSRILVDAHRFASHPTALAAAIGLILSSAAQAQTAAAAADNTDTIQEITVTAQRRAQTAQDIPYNISVLGGDQLGTSSLDNSNDLAKAVPGLLTVDTGPAARGNTNNFTLRGLRTDNPGAVDNPGQTVSPVSTYFGETPVFIPLVMRDLDHVEVLRGPQGTLYGSGSEAGTIRFIPNRPKFDQLTADVSVSGAKTENAGSFNNRVDGILNLPITSKLALRLVAGEEHLGGFIDDVGIAVRQGSGFTAPPAPRVAGDPTSGFQIAAPLRGTNASEQSYARAALRWDPTEAIDLELTYLHQITTVDDCQCSNPNWQGGTMDLGSGAVPAFPNSSYTVPAGGHYRNTNLIQEPYANTVNLGSLVGSVDLGLATVTSASSVYSNGTNGTIDNTYQWYIPGGTNFLPYYANYPRTIAAENDQVTDKAFIQEVRLVSKGKHLFDYVVGLFYEHETGGSTVNQYMPGLQAYYGDVGFVSPNPQVGDLVLLANQQTRFTDRAVFGELTWNILDNWQLTGGARFFSQNFDVNYYEALPNCGVTCGDSLGAFRVLNSQAAHKHLFKLNSSYDISKDTKVYATYSEGFRRGGAAGLPPEGIYASAPQYFTYMPDFAKNYEIGIKGDLLDRRFQYNADVFLINLENFQFNSYSPSGLPAVYNGSTARSKGVEVELDAKVTQRLSTQLGYTYTDATVVDPTNIYDLPAFGGPGSTPVLAVAVPEGTRLPGVPKSVFNLGVDYMMPLAGTWSLDYHIGGTYHTSSPGAIPGVYLSGYTIPSAKILDAKITLDSGKAWSIDLFGDNLTSDPNISGAVGVQGLPLNTLNFRNVSRPRTIGLTARYHFE